MFNDPFIEAIKWLFMLTGMVVFIKYFVIGVSEIIKDLYYYWDVDKVDKAIRKLIDKLFTNER